MGKRKSAGRPNDLLIRLVYSAWKGYEHPKRIFGIFEKVRKQRKRNIGIRLIPSAREGFEVEYAV